MIANTFPIGRSNSRKVAKQGPDFAAEYVVERWTCGSSCASFAVIGVRTGRVYFGRFDIAYSGCASDPTKPMSIDRIPDCSS